MKKKELWIVNHYATPPGYGGLTRHYYLAKYIQKLGYDVKIFASSAIHNSSFNFIDDKDKSLYKETVINGVKYVHVKTNQYSGNGLGRIKNMLLFYFRSKKVLKIYGKKSLPDAIYTSSPVPFSALVTHSFAKKHNIQSVVEVRDLWPYSLYAYGIVKSKKTPLYMVLSMVEKKMYLGADKILFTMNNAVQYLREQKYSSKINYDKVYTVPNGMDFAELNSNFKTYKVKDKDLDDKTYKVVYAGSLRYTYNILMLFEVAKKLKNEKNIKFLIYGKGPDEEKLKKLISENKLKNIKVKGFVENKYLPYILSKCNLALIHGKETDISKYGMSTNKAILYLSSKLPVINCYINGHDDFKDNNCGITLSKYSVDDYVDKIMFFYNYSAADRKKYQKNAYNYSKNFDYKNIAKKLKDILEEK